MIGPYLHLAISSGGFSNESTTAFCQSPAWFVHVPASLLPFMVSDVCDNSQSISKWLTILFAHFGLGAVLGLFLRRIALGIFVLWAGKELVADMPIAGWSGRVMLDSATDLVAGLLGLCTTLERRSYHR